MMMAVLLVVVLPVIVGRWIAHGQLRSTDWRILADLGGLTIVFLAGFYDDHRPGIHRGLRGHLVQLARGRVTPGTVKLVAALVAGGLIAAVSGSGAIRSVLGVPVMAGAANLWNLLDVRPGRAIKYFILVAVPLVIVTPAADYRLIGSATLAVACLGLWMDLREQAMLGDAGSNLLGLVAGIGVFHLRSIVGLALALAAILVLHLVAETVTLSRVIQGTPPLRWFDRLGRLRAPPSEPEGGREGSESATM
jgi:UDP-N-acetylmuramyl pentapeptide phosphotransferase/UDP-N-acetylglucosamine-1-phosphate transferase